jgi:hypothetical protein
MAEKKHEQRQNAQQDLQSYVIARPYNVSPKPVDGSQFRTNRRHPQLGL